MCGMMFRTVCLGHLGVWGELASHKRLFNPPSQFSRLGIQVSSLYIFIYSCLYGMVGTEGWVGMDCLSFLFSILLLVCYTRVLSCKYVHVESTDRGMFRSLSSVDGIG